MAASQKVAKYSVGDLAPAHDGVAVTKSDTALTQPCRAVYVGTAGDVAVKFAGGTAVTFKNVANGTLLPIAVSHIMSTNTTASDLVALY